MIGVVPNVLLIAPSKNIRSAKELAERAKAGDMTYASAGVGSATHWAAERFRLSAGFKATHIPFRGGPDALTEVMTGRVDFMCIGTSSGLPFIRDGKLLPLAVTTQKRSAALPEVPTTLELGFADSDYTFWNGFLAPAQTPKPIIERLHGEITQNPGAAGREGKARRPGRRAAAALAGGVRRADAARDRRAISRSPRRPG